ncbi:MAG: hypothetical protein JW820_13695 [Spirochaetales bacterium]|nr:hypothetical protein [Spirochaetales bacterium]
MGKTEGQGCVVKVLVVCPVPAEFSACREVLRMRDLDAMAGCRSSHIVIGSLELVAVESGPGKARAAAATGSACHAHEPELVIDSGSCAGLDREAEVGQVVMATASCEYDIGGDSVPKRSLEALRLPAAFSHLDAGRAATLQREAVQIGARGGHVVRLGPQACGEFLVQSPALRGRLHSLFQALGANWESTAVFVAAFRSGRPALSVRVVTDLGGEQALVEFRRNVRGRARDLYGYLAELAEEGWLSRFVRQWRELDPARRQRLAATVRP